MEQDRTRRGSFEEARIDVSRYQDVRYWCVKFAVTPLLLLDAVRKVGPMADKVRMEQAGQCSAGRHAKGDANAA